MARTWDPLVRLTHWGIAAAVIANGLLTEPGKAIHVWTGVAAAALLVLRLAWGLVGPAEARFSAFAPSPSRAIAHVGDILGGRHRQHRSHNPLGALMVYAIWGTLALVVGTGMAMTFGPGATPMWGKPTGMEVGTAPSRPVGFRLVDAGEEEEEPEGAAMAEETEAEEGPLGEVHEAAANLLFLLAGLHVAGVLFETARSGRGTLRRMTVGTRE